MQYTILDFMKRVEISAGGPGSGCRGPNCGRKPGGGSEEAAHHATVLYHALHDANYHEAAQELGRSFQKHGVDVNQNWIKPGTDHEPTKAYEEGTDLAYQNKWHGEGILKSGESRFKNSPEYKAVVRNIRKRVQSGELR